MRGSWPGPCAPDALPPGSSSRVIVGSVIDPTYLHRFRHEGNMPLPDELRAGRAADAKGPT